MLDSGLEWVPRYYQVPKYSIYRVMQGNEGRCSCAAREALRGVAAAAGCRCGGDVGRCSLFRCFVVVVDVDVVGFSSLGLFISCHSRTEKTIRIRIRIMPTIVRIMGIPDEYSWGCSAYGDSTRNQPEQEWVAGAGRPRAS